MMIVNAAILRGAQVRAPQDDGSVVADSQPAASTVARWNAGRAEQASI
jgi:hypothetical protein